MQGREDIHSWASSTTAIGPSYYPSSPPVPVVSNQDADAEDDCPVCLEPLSFSFRLPGEKPHIVPECGHALHEVRKITPSCVVTQLIIILGMLLSRVRPYSSWWRGSLKVPRRLWSLSSTDESWR